MTAAPQGPPRWVVCPPPDAAAVHRLAAELSLPEPLAAILVQRGHADPAAARRFLRPQLSELADPLSLVDMNRAVEVIAGAVRARRRILVHGDYDVDGQCASALLTRALRFAGGDVTAFVPHRLRDGYDFGEAGLAKAREIGASLIITCDCGITAVGPVRSARDAGIQVVVTDGAKEQIVREGYDATYGARPLKRTIQRRVLDVLAMRVLEGEFVEGDTVVVDVGADGLAFRKRSPVMVP